ncbi:MAG: hypothetical protein K0Q47_1050 [Sedimentibacter sp.]|nr:hypothetical protein [Sedimentibacter sp.]
MFNTIEEAIQELKMGNMVIVQEHGYKQYGP